MSYVLLMNVYFERWLIIISGNKRQGYIGYKVRDYTRDGDKIIFNNNVRNRVKIKI
jgi:ASC-1-like (ASCH) protein